MADVAVADSLHGLAVCGLRTALREYIAILIIDRTNLARDGERHIWELTWKPRMACHAEVAQTYARACCDINVADKYLRYSFTINKIPTSIVTSELFAILHALYFVDSKVFKVVIVADTLSSLQSITNWNWKKLSFTNKVALLCSTLSATDNEVHFHFIPGNQNIPGNQIADQLAKLSTAEPSPNPPECILYKHVNIRLNFSYMLSFLYQQWFQAWEIHYQTEQRGNACKDIFPALQQFSLPIKSLSTIIFRLYTGHCQLNHHMSRIGFHPYGFSGQCEVPETVEHFIEVFSKYSEVRQHLQHALNQIGVTSHTPATLRNTAAAKHAETFYESQAYVSTFLLSGSGTTRPRSQKVSSPASYDNNKSPRVFS